MATPATPRPVPTDRDQPVTPPSPLAALALAQGVSAHDVRAYVASRAVPSFRIVATCVALQAVSL